MVGWPICNRTQNFSDEEIEEIIRSRLVPYLEEFCKMRKFALVELPGFGGRIVKFTVYATDSRKPEDASFVVEDEAETRATSSLVFVSGYYFHEASQYSENFTGKGETIADALYDWRQKANKGEIEINSRGDIEFPGNPAFYLYYQPRKGGWQPAGDDKDLKYADRVFLGSMPRRWERAWDEFCKTRPKFAKRRKQDEALIHIVIPQSTGPQIQL